MNYSKQRECILEILEANVVHPTAEHIQKLMEQKYGSVSTATLYRNLNQLAEHGIIKKIDGLEAPSHFDHNCHEHFHFMCDKCKRIYDVSSAVAPDIVHNTEAELGVKVTKYDIIFHGICENCK